MSHVFCIPLEGMPLEGIPLEGMPLEESFGNCVNLSVCEKPQIPGPLFSVLYSFYLITLSVACSM